MGMMGRTECAVRGCTNPLSGVGNLCGIHQVPGAIVRLGENTMIITSWLAQRGHEQGIIVLNDFALGDLFCGADGFIAKLREQGFTNVRNLATPVELETARATTLASWSGSWRAKYPWQKSAQEKERAFSDLRALVRTNVASQNGDALMALIYRDGSIRLKYPDGDAVNIDLQGRVESPLTLDEQIEMAEKSMRAYCSTFTPETPQITVHRAPAGLDDEGTRKWLESLPGIKVVEDHELPHGFGGPFPSDGKAG
jgi:hypothetical protein